MAEGLLNYTRLDDPDEEVYTTQGRPCSADDEIRIVDEDGGDAPPGAPGELLARGPYTIRGYYNVPEHNLRAFTSNGYYRSGDVVRLSALGNLVVEGREKDLINRGGEKISAEEIENLILAHPSVFNAAAVAMPDATLGERTCAYVILRPGANLTLPELVVFLDAQQIAKFKLPERLEVIDAFPLTSVGKVFQERPARRHHAQARRRGIIGGLTWWRPARCSSFSNWRLTPLQYNRMVVSMQIAPPDFDRMFGALADRHPARHRPPRDRRPRRASSSWPATTR